MKLIITVIVLALTGSAFAQSSFEVWQSEAKSNKRLLPRYGHLPKSDREILADSSYIKETMAQPQFKTRREASSHLINLGFQYYNRPDLKTAMYRFNQAYLLDSTNTDIFWGYGAIYMALMQFDLAKEQYLTGLAIDPNNTHLMTDLATYFMQQYYLIGQIPQNSQIKGGRDQGGRFMDSAIHHLQKSYLIDPNDVNTAYKLSICYWNINDCPNAWKYYNIAMALGGGPITKEYTDDLNKKCRRN